MKGNVLYIFICFIFLNACSNTYVFAQKESNIKIAASKILHFLKNYDSYIPISESTYQKLLDKNLIEPHNLKNKLAIDSILFSFDENDYYKYYLTLKLNQKVIFLSKYERLFDAVFIEKVLNDNYMSSEIIAINIYNYHLYNVSKYPHLKNKILEAIFQSLNKDNLGILRKIQAVSILLDEKYKEEEVKQKFIRDILPFQLQDGSFPVKMQSTIASFEASVLAFYILNKLN